MLVLLIVLLPSVSFAEDSQLRSLKKILFKEDSTLDGTFRVRHEHPRLKAIRQLEADGSAQAVRILKDFLTTHRAERKLKQHALTALGKIGTQDAIDAILKFDLWSKTRFLKPPPFRLGKTDHPMYTFSAYYLDPTAKVIDQKGKTWAIFPWSRYGTQDFWLTCSDKKDAWSQPILLDLPGMPHLARVSDRAFDKKCQFQINNDSVTVTCDGKVIKASISKSLTDSDKDGLPDVVEARFLTDPTNPDSDKDGVVDGNDTNPLTPKHKKTNDLTEIRQAVFSVLFATCAAQDTIVIVEKDFVKQEYYGNVGAVLRSPQKRREFVNIMDITVKLESHTAATVTVSVSLSSHKAKLKKINGKWVVVQFTLGKIS
jgi:hypothetical protein